MNIYEYIHILSTIKCTNEVKYAMFLNEDVSI